MLENELKKIWQNSTPEEIVKFDKSRILIEIDNHLEKFNKGLKARDRREILVATFLIPLFTVAVFLVPGILSKIALGLAIPYCLMIIYILKNVKKYAVSDFSLSLREFLIKQRDYLLKERSLLDNVLYWYILPPTFSMALFFYSVQISPLRLVINIGVVLLIMMGIYYLNKKAVKEDFDPLIKKLNYTIKKLETE